MSKFKLFLKQFHWKIFLIRILVNAAALSLTVVIIPDIYFIAPTFLSIMLIAVGLGILNAIVKPIILLLTGQFIFVTFGLLVVLVNALILYLLERLFPNSFMVNNFFWALVGGAVLGMVSNALENLLGLTPPIVPDENLELRKRIESKQQASLVSLVTSPPEIVQPDVETQSVSELTAASAVLDALHVEAAPVSSSPASSENPAEPSESIPPPPDASQIPGQETPVDEKNDLEPSGGES